MGIIPLPNETGRLGSYTGKVFVAEKMALGVTLCLEQEHEELGGDGDLDNNNDKYNDHNDLGGALPM